MGVYLCCERNVVNGVGPAVRFVEPRKCEYAVSYVGYTGGPVDSSYVVYALFKVFVFVAFHRVA